jgi:hypothetical protein
VTRAKRRRSSKRKPYSFKLGAFLDDFYWALAEFNVLSNAEGFGWYLGRKSQTDHELVIRLLRRYDTKPLSWLCRQDVFVDLVYETLRAWGVGKRGSTLVARPAFGSRVRKLVASPAFKRLADCEIKDVRDSTTWRNDLLSLWKQLRGPRSEGGREHDVESPTGAMHDFYARYEPEIAKAREVLAPIPGEVGAVASVAGRWAGLDLLVGPRLFSRAWPRLCAGYAADALRRTPAARHVPGTSRLLKMLAACPVQPAPAVGIGEEYRLAGEKLAGATLVAEERVAHLMAFPADAAH